MSTIQYEVECKQCGFPYACKEFDGRSYEYEVGCTRCGFREMWKSKSFFSNGHLECCVKEVLYSAGACCIKTIDKGIETHYSLAESEIEETAAKMRDDVAAGKLSAESYVTRFDFITHQVTPLVGRVPVAQGDGSESSEGAFIELERVGEETRETVGEQGGE